MGIINTRANGYKNTSTSERIHPSKLNPPVKVIDGKIVEATHNGKTWVWNI